MRTQIQVLLFAILLLLCACSCRNTSYPKAMQLADSIVNTSPDSAVVLLEQLKDSILSEPQSTQMYYHLLSIKAKDKAYIPHTSDNLILQVIHYYEEKEDEKYLPETYYYAGRIYRDLGDAPQALDYFQKTIDLIGEGTDYKLNSKVYSQMGTLYMYQDIYDEAMKAYKKAYKFGALTNDSTAMIFNLRNIGLTFSGKNDIDSSLYYCKEAYRQAQSAKNQELMHMIQISIASLYKQLKKYDMAKAELEQLSQNNRDIRQSAILSVYADLYYQTKDFDSAAYYYNQLLKIGTIYAKQTAHWRLATISKKQTNYTTMLSHIHKYMEYTDTIQKRTDIETIRKMQSLYNYQLREKDNHHLRIKNAQQKLLICYILFAVIITILFVIIYVQHNKRKKQLLNEQVNKLIKYQEEQYRKSNQFIEANKIKIQELEKQLQDSTLENDTLKALLETQKEQIMLMNYQITTDQKEQELADAAFKQSDIYNFFHNAINNDNIKLTKEDWITLQLQVDRCYKDFTHRLRTLYPISDIELQICLLLKIDITTTGIAILTGRSKSAIVSARKKLYEKVYGEKGKPEQWDAFITSF